MKHAALRAIIHNLADSLSGGVSLLAGSYDLDIYRDADRAGPAGVTVDFLNATADTPVAQPVRDALPKLRDALERLCRDAGGSIADFRVAQARFLSDGIHRKFTVIVEDRRGKRSAADYAGTPGARLRHTDPLGRIRRGATRLD
ncbi:MAG: hypothetical protein DI616_10505 [Paracoccus denitrificans]|uniref:Uncharacterized protein n=1 Tax=Paracoccus denitrificans TaxID=266 RepID=A0A533I5M2_PARDE|nr:MAG: hypothetical protein DI616_10505 [Paracoccus denitrificans]